MFIRSIAAAAESSSVKLSSPSPDEMNRNIQTVVIAPLSAASVKYPTRIEVDFLNNRRSIVLDQIRTVDHARLVKKIGSIDKNAQKETLEKLQEMFAE